MADKGKVYVVHCIDTEGPLYEDKGVIFEQIEKIYGITVEPTEENYLRLKSGQMDFGKDTEAIKKLVGLHQVTTKGSWKEIDEALDEITTKEFRNVLPDSSGNGWKYSWFCMDHVGFTGENPRRRDAGHHKVFDHYMKMIQEQNLGDTVQFHHHPVPFSGNYHDSGTAFWGKGTLNEILARKIIDRMWFPSAFRPGFHTERPDSNWFLEQWIPFDYGNQATEVEEDSQPDFSAGRFPNWSRAPKEWIPYHPSHDDYQLKGGCRRWITRCLNMKARAREISINDIEEAFATADIGQSVILAFTDHDYKDMKSEVIRVRDMISKTAAKYSEVKFYYSDALQAMRDVLELRTQEIGLDIDMTKAGINAMIKINGQSDIFGPQPFLALKTKGGQYYWDNLDFIGKNEWSYVFDNNTLDIKDVEKIGVASNNASGVVEVLLLDVSTGKCEKRCLNL
jgi:hypothetical protein